MKISMMTGVAAILMMGAAVAGEWALGVRGDESRVTREVMISPETRWVNVESGETIRFVDGAGHSVVWRFDTPSWATGRLGDFAPDIARGRQITVYVAEPTLYKPDI